ncbi:MAG: DsbA family protein [Spirochaetia bacterium]|nr:DsbA family protein [Spirochaetia bacterium]
MKNREKMIALTAFIMVALFAGAAYYFKNKKAEEQRLILENNRKRLVKDYSPVYGNTNAPVEIVEFLDPECESCKKFYPFVKKILNNFNGKVKLVVRYAPFHKNSIFALKILEAARNQNKYWETMTTLFEMQPQWGDHHNPKPMLIWNYLPDLGLDISQIKIDMESDEIMNRINTDIEDGKFLNVKKTPTFFVNGRPLQEFGYRQLFDLVKKTVEELD